MKRVISGVRYDTATAVFIGAHTHGDYPRAPHSFRASLYKTPRAYRFFLCGDGGAMTRFAGTTGMETIVPLEKAEAYAWAMEYLDEEVIDQYFFSFKHQIRTR